jgi:hypothetical protein
MGIVYAGTYAAVAMGFGVLSTQERATVSQVLGRVQLIRSLLPTQDAVR